MPRPTRKSYRRKPWADSSGAKAGLAEERPRGSSREYVRLLFAGAAELMGGEHEGEIRDFIVSVFQLNELLRAFRKSPRGEVGGDEGVAAQLNISRAAVYVWLDSLGLDAGDLRSGAELAELLHKSPVLRRTVEKLLPRGLTCSYGVDGG
jgi:hypothetical protein